MYIRHIEKHWMDVCLSSTNARRYINITKVVTQTSPFLIHTLPPGIHIFTGPDFISEFANKGKTRPLKMSENSDDFKNTFCHLGNSTDIAEESVDKCVCALYGNPNMSNVNSVGFSSSSIILCIKKLRKIIR